jgi:hypothetical protein
MKIVFENADAGLIAEVNGNVVVFADSDADLVIATLAYASPELAKAAADGLVNGTAVPAHVAHTPGDWEPRDAAGFEGGFAANH